MFQVGSTISGQSFLVESSSLSETKKGSKYLKLTLRDRASSISGNLWDYNEAIHAFIKPGVVVRVTGDIGSYNDQPQITVRQAEPSAEPVEKFARSSTIDNEMMWNSLVDDVSKMEEPLTKYVLEELLIKSLSVAFQKAPAARGVHNAWYGGLMEHVWSMTQMATRVVQHYRQLYSAPISADKVKFGLIAHDLGKTMEYDFSTPAFASTPLGILTNHLVLGPAWIYEHANKWWLLPAGSRDQTMTAEQFKLERAHLMHLVASHHGSLEWGSPVVPSTLEAVIVHQMDMLDSKVMHALEFVQNKPGTIAGFSEKSHIAQTCFKR